MTDVIQGTYYVTQQYGPTTYTGEWMVPWSPTGYFHCGIDLGAVRGLPVLAPRSGRCYGIGDMYLGPCTVGLDIGGGVYLAFGHLDRASVSVGQQVTAGQEIGKLGNLGISTGPHLHLRASTAPWPLESPNNCIDPGPYLKVQGGGEPAPPPEEELDKMLVVFTVRGGTYVSDGIHYRWVANQWDQNALGYNWTGNQLKNIGAINGFAGFGVPADRATAELSGQEWSEGGPRGPAT